MRVDEHLKQAMLAHRAGQLASAEGHYRAALGSDPKNFPAASLLGTLFLQSQNFVEAEAVLRQAVQINPADAGTLANHATALLALNRFEEAAAGCERCLALAPSNAAALYTRARALTGLKRYEDALTSFAQALALKPDFFEALQESSNLLLHLGRSGDALAACERALAQRPGFASALKNRAAALQNLGRAQESIRAWQDAIAAAPDDAAAHVDLGYALQRIGQHAKAIEIFDWAAAINPDARYLSGARLFSKLSLCDWNGFEQDCADVLARVDRGELVGPPFYLLPLPSSPAQQLAAARAYARDQYPATGAAAQPSGPVRRMRLRVGYLSTDFRSHAVAMLMTGIIEQHDPERVETIGLSLSPGDGSSWRARLEKAFVQFVDLEQMSDPEAAEKIRALDLDILVDLNGHTQGARTGILARRPAPLQVNFLGFPATMGAEYIDYIIADRTLVPVEDEIHYAEKIAAMPVCYQPNARRAIAEHTPRRADCGLPDRGIVLCCFNHSYKITPDIFAVWMRLLRALPDSVLWLKDTGSDTRANLARAAAAQGVEATRLVFAPQVANVEDHLARHRLADIFVDTPHYNAHVTASDALMCGLPVLACEGRSYAGRVSASLLRALDLSDMITPSLEAYEALALELMRAPNRIAAMKARLTANLESTPLFDSAHFTRDLERAYRAMAERRSIGLPPASFTLE